MSKVQNWEACHTGTVTGVDFPCKTMEAWKKWYNICKLLEKKEISMQNSTSSVIKFHEWNDIKTVSEKKKTKGIVLPADLP